MHDSAVLRSGTFHDGDRSRRDFDMVRIYRMRGDYGCPGSRFQHYYRDRQGRHQVGFLQCKSFETRNLGCDDESRRRTGPVDVHRPERNDSIAL